MHYSYAWAMASDSLSVCEDLAYSSPLGRTLELSMGGVERQRARVVKVNETPKIVLTTRIGIKLGER